MITMNSPCRNCQDRHPACHDTCEKYIEVVRAYQAEKERIRKIKAQEQNYNDFKCINVANTKKNSCRKRRKGM